MPSFVVPALPVLLPLGVLHMLVSWLVLRRRGEPTVRRLGAVWLAGWYAVAVLGATLLPLEVSWGADAGPTEYFRINPIPLTRLRVSDFVLNVLMTLPLAAALAVVAGVRDRRGVLRAALLLSAGIEVVQCLLILALHGNRWAEANDLIANVLGAYLGHLAFRRLLRRPALRQAVESASPTAAQRA
jgi:glycopeptide antibiotics resistance protein